jgi:hypothetical protein
MVVFYGGWVLFTKFQQITSISQWVLFAITIWTFLITIYLFYYGYMNNTLCYHSDKKISNYTHSLLHVISSFGHILIVLL